MKKIIVLCVLILALVGCAQTKSIETFYNLESVTFDEMVLTKMGISGDTTGTYNGDEVYEFIKTIVPKKIKTATAEGISGNVNYTLVIKTNKTSYALAIGDDFISIVPADSGELMYNEVSSEDIEELEHLLEDILKFFKF